MDVQELRLKSYRLVIQSDEKYVGNRVMVVDVQRKNRKGRQKRSWMNSIKHNLTETANGHEHRLHTKVGKYVYAEEE